MVLVAKSRKNKKRTTRIIILVVIICVLLVGAAAGFIALGYHVSSLDTIFPDVWAEGLDMSGLTFEEAKQALIDSGYEQSASEISVTVVFPYDVSFTVNGEEVGLKLSAAEAAAAAYSFGRDGSFFANEITYIKSLFGKTELNELSLPDYDTTVIRELAEEYTQIFNESLFDNNLEISESSITIVKGTSYAPVTADEVFNFAELSMKRAIEQHDHIEVRFLPAESAEEGIDLSSIHSHIHVEPISSTYDMQRGNPKSINYDSVNMGATESSAGKTFDLQEAEENLRNAESGATVVIPVYVLEPELSQEQLRDMLFRDVLAERQAGQGSSSARSTNVRLAAAAVNDLVLQPGETFSFNDIVGKRTAENGYQEANAIVNGEFVPTLGGGICQVTSVLYSALLQTDFEIVSRTIHGRMVGYLPGGQDATVAYGNIDFKFKNNSDYPIRLEVITTGAVTVSLKIYGTREKEVYYRVESKEDLDNSPIAIEVIERAHTENDGEKPKPGERITLSEGNVGRIFEVYRHHYSDPEFNNPILDSNGNPVVTRVSRDTYRMRPKIIVYDKDAPQATPKPTAPPTDPPPTEPPPSDPTPPPEEHHGPPEE